MTEQRGRTGPKPADTATGGDSFWLTDLYPEADQLFSHAPAPLGEVKGSCFVVLDANVLLWPYEFNSASLAEVNRVYGELKAQARLVVPGQAAREFYKHRSRKVAALSEVLDGAITRASKSALQQSIPLLQDDPDYKAAQKLSKELTNTGKKLIEKLEAVKSRLQSDIAADPVSTIYREQLPGCIAELDATDRQAILNEVERRGRLRIAPGFKDQAKEDGGVGDYLIWLTILETAAKRKSHCIFVTNEEKSDWWIKSGGAFQPRPELLDEYRRASGGQTIHLLPLSELLSLFSAEPEVVQGVQNLEEASRQRYNSAAISKAVSVLREGFEATARQRSQLEEERATLASRLGELQQTIDSAETQLDSDVTRGNYEKLLGELDRLNLEKRIVQDKLAENAKLFVMYNHSNASRELLFPGSKSQSDISRLLGIPSRPTLL